MRVFKNKKIIEVKVFKNIARTWKFTLGWLNGCKRYIVNNDIGELISFC
ncbi:transposase [Flavobacterium sp. SM2513]